MWLSHRWSPTIALTRSCADDIGCRPMCTLFCSSWKDLEGPQKKLAVRVKRFFAAKKDRLSEIVPRFVVVDGVERQEQRNNDCNVTKRY